MAASILIIDDDLQIRELCSDVLSDDGFVAQAVSSGCEGIDLIRRSRVDLVITDILMPEKDGIETLLEIKSVNPEIKVIVMSGGGISAQTIFLETAGKLGADATLAKPVDIDELSRVVTTLINA